MTILKRSSCRALRLTCNTQLRFVRHRRAPVAHGFTISEALALVAVLALLTAALLPSVARMRAEGGQAVSAANLKTLAAAHAAYAADFNDRQVGWIAEDFAFTGGTPQGYAANIGCQSQLLLGFGESGGIWGYYLPCALSGGQTANIAFYKPFQFGTSAQALGSHRLPNARAFAAYVDGRFYDSTFYAPDDTITHQLASPAFDDPNEFVWGGPTGPANPNTGAAIIVYSSYALSPAAMWNPTVLSRNDDTGLWYTDPDSIPLGYRAPAVSQCAFPDLKTRMIEHNWNLGQPGPVNPAYADGITPYAYSHGIDASPLALFFDGSVASLPNAQVAVDDATILAATAGEVGLWTRDTPLGGTGYLGDATFDGFVTGHHMLTAGGILGRDRLSASGGVAGGMGSADGAKASRARVPVRRVAPGSLPSPNALAPQRRDPADQGGQVGQEVPR